ncbi:unnamed protein product [Closterium sp. NIES-53]
MAWNAFKFCTGLKILGSIMILVVLAIVAVTYYAVVIASYGPELSKGGSTSFLAFLVLAVFHGLVRLLVRLLTPCRSPLVIRLYQLVYSAVEFRNTHLSLDSFDPQHKILGMLLWSYFSVVLTDPGGVPPDWHPFFRGDDDLEEQSLQTLDTHRQAALGNYPPSVAAAAASADSGRSGSAASVASAGVLSESASDDRDNEDDSSSMDDPRAALVGPAGGRAGMENGGKQQDQQQQQQQSQAVSRGGGAGMIGGRDGMGDAGMGSGAVEIRRCKRCLQFKPPRAHHCSVCGRCILKMDHHCVWVINCVGAKNYKQFLLFLFYTFVETAMVAVALLPHFIDFFTTPPSASDDATKLATVFLSFGTSRLPLPATSPSLLPFPPSPSFPPYAFHSAGIPHHARLSRAWQHHHNRGTCYHVPPPPRLCYEPSLPPFLPSAAGLPHHACVSRARQHHHHRGMTFHHSCHSTPQVPFFPHLLMLGRARCSCSDVHAAHAPLFSLPPTVPAAHALPAVAMPRRRLRKGGRTDGGTTWEGEGTLSRYGAIAVCVFL